MNGYLSSWLRSGLPFPTTITIRIAEVLNRARSTRSFLLKTAAVSFVGYFYRFEDDICICSSPACSSSDLSDKSGAIAAANHLHMLEATAAPSLRSSHLLDISFG